MAARAAPHAANAALPSQEDAVYALRDENRALKSLINSQDDKARRLTVQVQKLHEDLARQRAPESHSAARPPHRKDSRDEANLIAELRHQVQHLSKNNTSLKTKMHFFKSLHEAEARRRTPYDHIPPRVNSALAGKRQFAAPPQKNTVSLYTSNNTNNEPAQSGRTEQEIEEELIQQQELVNLLRSKLVEVENSRQTALMDVKRVQQDSERRQQQDDIDRLALQHELNELKKRSTYIRGKYESLDEAHRLLEATHRELISVTEKMRTDLAAERQRALDLEHAMQNASIQRQTEDELLLIIEDLRREKSMVEQELQKILDNQFGSQRETKYQKEILELRQRVMDLELQIKTHIEDKVSLNATIQELNMRLQSLIASESEARADLFNAMHEIDQLKDRLRFFSHNGEINVSEIEEALTMVRLKRERGITLDFLIQLDSAAGDKRALQDLRVQFAECAQELEKATRLLRIQEALNRDYKAEVEQLKQQLESLANEYELRLEEDAQLLDLRSQRIAILEAQLKNIAYGVSKPLKSDYVENLVDVESGQPLGPIEPGQTVLDFHIEAALFTEDGRKHINQTIPSTQNIGDHIFTFVSLDFFEFETELTGLGMTWAPRYNHAIRYKVYADDYFLAFLQTQRVAIKVFHTNLTEFTFLGQCHVSFKDFVDDSKPIKQRFISDIISADQKLVLGKLDYTIQMLTPIALAIRAFKERTVALNLLNLDDPTSKTSINASRVTINRLTIAIRSGTFLGRGPMRDPPRIYGVVSFGMDVRLFATTVITGTYSPIFDFEHTIPLAMTTSLDLHLRTSRCDIVFCDAVHDVFYGSVGVSMDVLARGEKIDNTFDIIGMNRSPCGTISVSMFWAAPYVIDSVQSKLIVAAAIASEAKEKKAEMVVEPSAPRQQPQSHSKTLPERKVEPPIPTVVSPSEPPEEIDAPVVTHSSEANQGRHVKNDMAIHQSVSLPDMITIRIDSLQLHLSDPEVDALLARTKQAFVSFDFLGYPLDELETKSVVVTQSGLISFNYVKGFPIDADTHAGERKQVQEMAGSVNASGHKIVFTLVDEPPEMGDGVHAGECVDVGVAELDLGKALRAGDTGVNAPVLSVVRARDDRHEQRCIGTLRVFVTGA